MSGARHLAVVPVVVLSVVLTAVACGGEPSEEDRITAVMHEFFEAFEDADSEKLAGLFGELCENMQENAITAIADLDTLGENIEFNLNSVDVRNVADGFAEALPIGTISVDGQTSPLSNPDDDYSRFVLEDGEWRIAECDLFL